MHSHSVYAALSKQEQEIKLWAFQTLSSLYTFEEHNYWSNIKAHKDHLSLSGCRKLSWMLDRLRIRGKDKKFLPPVIAGASQRYPMRYYLSQMTIKKLNNTRAKKRFDVNGSKVWEIALLTSVTFPRRAILKNYRLFIGLYVAQASPQDKNYIIVGASAIGMARGMRYQNKKYKKSKYKECESIGFRYE